MKRRPPYEPQRREDSSTQPGSPMERFFRHGPDEMPPGMRITTTAMASAIWLRRPRRILIVVALKLAKELRQSLACTDIAET